MEENSKFTPEGNRIIAINLTIFAIALLTPKIFYTIFDYYYFSIDVPRMLFYFMIFHILILLLTAIYHYYSGNKEISKYIYLSLVFILTIGFPVCIWTWH